jgi:hypothetical protein
MDLALHGHSVMRLARMSERRRDQATSRNSEPNNFGESNHLARFQLDFGDSEKQGNWLFLLMIEPILK